MFIVDGSADSRRRRNSKVDRPILSVQIQPNVEKLIAQSITVQ